MNLAVVGVVFALGLCACSEKPQTATQRKADGHAYEGTGNSAYAAAGWKAGDAASWEKVMKEIGRASCRERVYSSV